MKGIVFTEFIEFVEDSFGFEVTQEMIEASSLSNDGVYTGIGTYNASELVAMVVQLSGLVKKEIATRLSISSHTVITHIRRLYEKLNATNAPSAVNKAYRMGIFPSRRQEDSEHLHK